MSNVYAYKQLKQNIELLGSGFQKL